MRGRAEAIDAKPSGGSGPQQGTVADQAGAEQRRRVRIRQTAQA
jgi:hypothetical protein